MNTEIIEVWEYSVFLKIRPLLFSCPNIVLEYDFQDILDNVRQCCSLFWKPLLEVSGFSCLGGIWKIIHTVVSSLLLKSVGELPLISVGAGLSWYLHKNLTLKFYLNLKSHILSFFVNPNDTGFKEHLPRFIAMGIYKSHLCSSPAKIIENFAFV